MFLEEGYFTYQYLLKLCREGYELQVGQPQVIIKEIDGVKCEPIEELTIDLPEIYSGKAIEVVAIKKGEMLSMIPKGDRMLLEFNIPSRGIIGLRNYLLTVTAELNNVS